MLNNIQEAFTHFVTFLSRDITITTQEYPSYIRIQAHGVDYIMRETTHVVLSDLKLNTIGIYSTALGWTFYTDFYHGLRDNTIYLT